MPLQQRLSKIHIKLYWEKCQNRKKKVLASVYWNTKGMSLVDYCKKVKEFYAIFLLANRILSTLSTVKYCEYC